MEQELMNKQIDESEQRENEFAKRMKSAIKILSGLTIIIYVMIVWPLLYMGINTLTIPVIGYVTSAIVVPTLTFFSGMWIVWKYKFIR